MNKLKDSARDTGVIPFSDPVLVPVIEGLETAAQGGLGRGAGNTC